MTKNIHTVIFDLDGTLSNSALLTVDAFKKIAPAFGLPIPSEEAIRRATGFATPEFYYILFPDHPKEIVIKAGEQVELEELIIIKSISHKLLFDGCRDLLLQLKDMDKRLCIASTGDERHVLSVLNETGIINLFDIVLYGRPDKTEMLSEIIGESSKDGCIMVGDMKKDFEAARQNNIVSIGACFGYCIPEYTDFDYYADTPEDVLRIILEE